MIGQREVIKSLQNSIKNHMIGHAYIFEGPEGIGKRTMASIFAGTLVCDREDVEPCGVCVNCIKHESKNHPDIKVICDENAGSIGIDLIRELKKDMYIKPYESDRKIYIIPYAERMSVQAQNSLLKILEEPPQYGMIILTTANASLLLDTILSRAVLVRFRLHPYQEIRKYLEENCENESLHKEISFLASFCGGTIGKAKELANSEEFQNMRFHVSDIIIGLLEKDELKVLEDAGYFNEYKKLINPIFDFLLFWFRDILLIKELQNKRMLINQDMENKLYRFAQRVSKDAVIKIIDLVIDTKKKIDMNANYSLSIETMLIQSWEEVHGRSSRSTF